MMRYVTTAVYAVAALVLVLSVGGRPANAAADRPAYQVPAEIPADLSQDATGPLQQFIDSVPDGAAIRFPENAQYRIEGTLTIAGREGLTVEGNGALFRSFDKVTEGERLALRNRAHWRVGRGSRHIVLRNLRVRGPHDAGGTADEAWDAAREAQHAFDIDGASHVLLERVRGSHVFGDGVYIRSDHVTVRHSHIHNVGRQGMAVANARDVLIEHNDVRDVRRGIFNIEQYAAGWQSDNVRILNNTTGRSRLLWMPISGAGVAGSVLVAGNVMEAGTGVPVITNRARASGRRGPFVAIDNHFVVSGSPAAAFHFDGIDGLLLAGNTAILPERRRMTAVRAHDSRGVFVTGNRFEGAHQAVDFGEAADGFAAANRQRGQARLVELPGGYGARVQTDEGPLVAVWRMGQPQPGQQQAVLAAFELETDATMAIVQLDQSGRQVRRHYIFGEGTATFGSQRLPRDLDAP